MNTPTVSQMGSNERSSLLLAFYANNNFPVGFPFSISTGV
jgi:hypothetical protein